jgi:hypothetical protein
VCHIRSVKEVAQIVILQNFVIEAFRSSRDSATPPNQFKQVFDHGSSSSVNTFNTL